MPWDLPYMKCDYKILNTKKKSPMKQNLKVHKCWMDRASRFADLFLLMYPHTEVQIEIHWNPEETGMANISSAK